jgi:hypothetical protein
MSQPAIDTRVRDTENCADVTRVVSRRSLNMQYSFTGFRDNTGIRVFAFERTETDRSRTQFTVSMDLARVRSYGILMQELPLLCRKLLEKCDQDGVERTLTYTEENMRVYASDCALARAAARPSPRAKLREQAAAATDVVREVG